MRNCPLNSDGSDGKFTVVKSAVTAVTPILKNALTMLITVSDVSFDSDGTN